MRAKLMMLLSSISTLLLVSGCAVEVAGSYAIPKSPAVEAEAEAPASSARVEAIGQLVSPDGTPMGSGETEVSEVQGPFDGDPRLLKVRLSGLPVTDNELMVGDRPTIGSADPCFDIGPASAAGTPEEDSDVFEGELPFVLGPVDEPEMTVKEIVLYVATAYAKDTSGLDRSCINSVLAVGPLEWLDRGSNATDNSWL